MFKIIMSISFLLAIMIISIIAIKTNKKRNIEYDEMQIYHRGIAYKRSFLTLIFYNLAYGLFTEFSSYKIFINYTTAAFFGILIALLIFATYCIKHNAYIAIKENTKQRIRWFFILGILGIMNGITQLIDSNFLETKLITFDILNMLLGIILIIIGIQVHYKEKNNNIEEDTKEE